MSKPYSDAYIEVAERSLEAAGAALDSGVHENATFLAYHSLESAGGAFCVSRGVSYPRGHRQKLKTFVAASRRERFGRQAVQLAIELGSLRNLLLYPEALQNGSIRRPPEVLTPTQSRRLIGRTGALAARVKSVL